MHKNPMKSDHMLELIANEGKCVMQASEKQTVQ